MSGAEAETAPRGATGGLDGVLGPVAADLGVGGRRIALALLACITALGLLGSLHDATGTLQSFDLDAEVDFHGWVPSPDNVPAIFSALLLYATAGCAAVAAARSRSILWIVLAGTFVFAGTDELVSIHERLEAWVGVPWLIPYAPVILAVGIVWLFALDELWSHRSERLLWLGGAAAWVMAQGLEAIWFAVGSSSGPTSELTVPEEILEMIGSSMFLLALLLVLGRLATDRAARQP